RQRLTPTHTSKGGGRRYRYYVSQRLLQEGRGAAPGGIRLSAGEFEATVIHALANLLTDKARLIACCDTDVVSAATIRDRLQRARLLAEQLQTSPTEHVRRCVPRIDLSDDQMTILVRLAAIWSTTDVSDDDGATTSIVVPFQLLRCGMAMRLLVS